MGKSFGVIVPSHSAGMRTNFTGRPAATISLAAMPMLPSVKTPIVPPDQFANVPAGAGT